MLTVLDIIRMIKQLTWIQSIVESASEPPRPQVLRNKDVATHVMRFEKRMPQCHGHLAEEKASNSASGSITASG